VKIKISKALCDDIGNVKLKPFGIAPDAFFYGAKSKEVDLANFSKEDLATLISLVEASSVRGAKPFVAACKQWLLAIDNPESIKPRSCKEFEAALRIYLYHAPGHRLYKHDAQRGIWDAWFVSGTEYHPEVRRTRDGETTYTPPYVTARLIQREMGGGNTDSIHFKVDDCIGHGPREALAKQDYIIETPELRADYLKRVERFTECVNAVGRQFTATGLAEKVDRDDDDKYWWRRVTESIKLDRDGSVAKVVVDVHKEGDVSGDDEEAIVHTPGYNKTFWSRDPSKGIAKATDDEEDEAEVSGESEEPVKAQEHEVPIKPNMIVFDLQRHMRLRVDVGQLTEYVYDDKLGDKLILPKDSKLLVDMLLSQKSDFKDVISGKSGGSIILCAGVPGTGKTLTAEVYAETAHRPLYSVQAAQLGTNPEELEEELLKVFSRAARWNSILLIDEADVYVATRGQSLQQNAIVGVFLRVLEYYRGALFLTTNRADLVDDAVASRCVARIDYTAPPPEGLKRIWHVLADSAGVKVTDKTIDAIVEKYSDMTGRDVKNMLKLSRLLIEAYGGEVTVDIVDFAKKFKPTGTYRKPEEPVLVTLTRSKKKE
jgi:AAA+ superfamily predicted ATPase